MSFKTAGVIGAGAWGTALAEVCARAGLDVVLWAREPEVRESIAATGENMLFLPGVKLSKAITVTGDFAALAPCDFVLAVPPAQFLRPTLEAFAAHCLDAHGETPPLEMVLGDLVTEYQTSREIARAAKRGNVMLRMMEDFEISGDPAGRPSPTASIPARAKAAADHELARAALFNDPDLRPSALAWWQIWDADQSRWIDVTTRPAHLPPDPG